ncbi:hypothetical protein K461DRAFT_302975 [Myriangium duriaei CBS 260.36]|uniref:Uncharacterized protein n=1 Tax=Myriangium duriaei CBS 260.36 TaxID=1168546 RepID=A0A9P4ISP6_9PEZI|nr:hypothetical protein K461DRAFT_302975 [Myriangium duriaei CBS 260.36]
MLDAIVIDGIAVHHGPWYSWKSKLWILTLTNNEANWLLAAIALYITFYSQDYWYFHRWLTHALRYRDRKPQHVIQHQLQVALRNSGNPGSYMYKCVSILISWKNIPNAKAWRRCMPEIIFSCVVFTLWVLAGIFFANLLEDVSKDVLLLPSKTCGQTYTNLTLQPDSQLNWLRTRKSILAANLPRLNDCYLSEANETSSECSFFPVAALPINKTKAACPFANATMCLTDPILFHIGPIQSDKDLGIDTKPEDAVIYGRQVTCVPIDLSSVVGDQQLVTNDSSEADYLEPGTVIDTFNIGHGLIADGAYNVSLALSDKSAVSGYFLEWVERTMYTEINVYTDFRSSYQDADPDSNTFWVPNRTLFPATGNWNMMLLRQVGLKYTNPLEDPFLLATIHTTVRTSESLFYDTSVTKPNDAYTAMTCFTQHRFCDMYNQCSDWGALHSHGNISGFTSSGLRWSSTQMVILERIANQTSQFSVASLVQDFGTAALITAQSLVGSINIGEFSTSQWATEAFRWVAASLAILQYQTAWYVYGVQSESEGTGSISATAKSLEAVQLCERQRIGDVGANTRNFNLGGVLAVFLVGILVNGLCLFGDKVNHFALGFIKSERMKELWAQDGLFQLHRRHLEKREVDGWEGVYDDIPVTDRLVETMSTVVTTATASKEGIVAHVTAITE